MGTYFYSLAKKFQAGYNDVRQRRLEDLNIGRLKIIFIEAVRNLSSRKWIASGVEGNL